VNPLIKKTSELPALLFSEQQSLNNWLEINYDTSPGIRIHIAKKNSGVVTVTYGIALESALCYGWIDSQKEAFDEKTWLQRFTPRKANSIWSKVNKDKAEQLIANGKMKPSGLKAIEIAKQNGQWDKAYESQSNATIPDDFAVELERNVKAKAFYDSLDRQNKYAIIFRIHSVKKQETREKRMQQFITMLEKGEKIYP
jgi:uncharacterized protein YdeI (YjbR/CyaY-like superfamily)